MKKRLAIFCVLALSMSLLSGCMHGVVVTSPSDKEFQEAWADSMEEAAQEWAQDWEAAIDEAARSWSTQVKAIDDLLNDDGHWGDRLAEDPGDPAYSYVYCQQETLKAGQKEEDRKYEELVRFTVSASEDVVTLVILEELPSLLHVDLGDFLTFTIDVPAETAEALRDPSRFLE